MKRTVTQYIMLGVMLLLLVLIVSMYPEQKGAKAIGYQDQGLTTKVSNVSVPASDKSVRAD